MNKRYPKRYPKKYLGTEAQICQSIADFLANESTDEEYKKLENDDKKLDDFLGE